MSKAYKIGVDGGGTKTECILVDRAGAITGRHVGPGSNPSIIGPEQARLVVVNALRALCEESAICDPQSAISNTHIYAAGNRAFWRETACTLTDFGKVFTADDSYPVLELATHGAPGLVLHGGTGSFVAARAPDNTVHYAGGIGWRFGDGGSGYDLGRRAVARGLLDLQGWAPMSAIGATVREHAQADGLADAAAVTRFFYYHADPNGQIAALAPKIIRLAGEGEAAARQIIADSTCELLTLARSVVAKLFGATPPKSLPAGLSGPILTHPVVMNALTAQSPFRLSPVEGTPIEGVRRLLMRAT